MLCGIDYYEIKFWALNRTDFEKLISENKITKQGDLENSYQGMWVYYSDIKDYLVPVHTDSDFLIVHG